MAAVSLLKGACTLRDEDVLVDFIIEVEDEQFRVHKVIMASVSDYFKAMLSGGLAESKMDKVWLHEQSPHVVSSIIEFIYTGEFGVVKATTEELLACAVYLQMQAAINECTKLLLKDLNTLNCFHMLATFKIYSVDEGAAKVTQYIKSNIDEVMNVSPPELSFNGFQCFMDFWQKSEWELFLCVLEWVDEDKNHAQHLDDLLSHVRFALMTPEQLEAVKQSHVYIESNVALQDLVTAAEAFHNLPTYLKVVDESEQSRVRGDPVPICYTAGVASSSVFYSLHNRKSWKKHEAQLAPSLYEGVEGHVTVNNYLIVCDSITDDHGEPLIQTWHIFDPRTMTWSTMAPLNVARQGLGLIHHKNHLYALGGCTESEGQTRTLTDVIEKYHFETNSWEMIDTTLPIPLDDPGVCVIGDCVYVAGGCPDNKDDTEYTDRLDRLTMSTNTWQSRAPLPFEQRLFSPMDDVQVVKLWGEEVLFVIEDMYVMHYYSPSADQWSQWDCLSDVRSELVHEFCPSVIPHQGTLYLHSFAYTTKQNSTDGSLSRSTRDFADPGEGIGCAAWSLGYKGEKVTEVKLDDFPFDTNGRTFETHFTGLLAIPPKNLRRPKKLPARSRQPINQSRTRQPQE